MIKNQIDKAPIQHLILTASEYALFRLMVNQIN
ncbi:hypothetical protein DET48_1354 [Vibrio diazotrophicus]|uniref:Uncharacterized protein n=1 Tax=Vibrio diazotrophicus TaxID=685 RepID=A0A329ECY3_VIBDI|nr:hypothetical protein DET48_1354 [Vibrio diazotrophicus]